MKYLKLSFFLIITTIIALSIYKIVLFHQNLNNQTAISEYYLPLFDKIPKENEEEYDALHKEFRKELEPIKTVGKKEEKIEKIITYMSLLLCFLITFYYITIVIKDPLPKLNKFVLILLSSPFSLAMLSNFSFQYSYLNDYIESIGFTYIVVLIYTSVTSKYKTFGFFVLCIPLVLAPNLFLYYQNSFI